MTCQHYEFLQDCLSSFKPWPETVPVTPYVINWALTLIITGIQLHAKCFFPLKHDVHLIWTTLLGRTENAALSSDTGNLWSFPKLTVTGPASVPNKCFMISCLLTSSLEACRNPSFHKDFLFNNLSHLASVRLGVQPDLSAIPLSWMCLHHNSACLFTDRHYRLYDKYLVKPRAFHFVSFSLSVTHLFSPETFTHLCADHPPPLPHFLTWCMMSWLPNEKINEHNIGAS